jgi:hypothetical protein
LTIDFSYKWQTHVPRLIFEEGVGIFLVKPIEVRRVFKVQEMLMFSIDKTDRRLLA